MINITTPPDLRLFISGNYISVARGYNRTITFSTDLPPVATPPSPLVINGITNINLATYVATATSTGTPSSETRTFYYEVVSPKVVYKLFPDQTGVLFYDVSGVNTFPHPDIPTNNTNWIQNPQLLSSRIVLEQQVDSSWEILDQFPVGGVSSMHYWEGTKTLRSKLQKIVGGEVVFEAVGDVFQVTPHPFLGQGTKFKYQEAEPLTGYLWNNQYLTILPNKVYQIELTNDGIGYQYVYVSSSVSPTGSGYTYSSSSRTLTISNFPTTIDQLTFQLQLQTNAFINGLLVNTGSSLTTTINLSTEVVSPQLGDYEQTGCTKTIVFQDSTLINNPYFEGKGRVFYEIKIGNEWIPITSTPRGGFFSYSNCSLEPGTYQIRKRFIAREIPNCGGTSKIVLQTDWVLGSITVLDFVPRFELPKTQTCCLTVGEEQIITPTLIELNNELCEQDVLTGGYNPQEYDPEYYATFSAPEQLLTYFLERYDIETTQWMPVDIKEILIVSNNVASAVYRFKPTQLGPYRLTGVLKNCCEEVQSQISFDVCDCLQINRKCQPLEKCQDCQLYTFKNYCSQPQTVTIKTAKNNKVVHTVVVQPNSIYEHRFTQDDLYQLEYDGKIAILPVYCSIETCYNKLLKEQLCKTNTSGCCNDKELFNSRLATIQPIYQLFLNKLEKFNVKVNYRYTLIDVTNQLNDFQELDKIKEALLKYCDICRLNCPKCFDWDKGTCI
ncbi:MAG: hypothetical protein NZZ41_02285 [Candidatus Dojkabacteria bacterium]|nr:hypothetical protein [Candidatus Dojkabacteria bacterium]